jgi:hypothetical protein
MIDVANANARCVSSTSTSTMGTDKRQRNSHRSHAVDRPVPVRVTRLLSRVLADQFDATQLSQLSPEMRLKSLRWLFN